MHIVNRQLFVVLVIIASCANPVAPMGGAKDKAPPVAIRSEPPNGSVNFHASEIRIWFDEYFQLKDIQQQLLISPPFETMPDVKIRGKSLFIKIEESLKPNTTYTLYFGDAITDLNEGNPLLGYKYVFSTGSVLDSMELLGKVLNAFDLSPEKEIKIMLYDVYEDSVPYLHKPYYLSRTDKNGNFAFTHLRNIPYKIFALRDLNSNLLYDLPNEEVAFSDTLLHPYPPPPKTISGSDREPDTINLQTETEHKRKKGAEENKQLEVLSPGRAAPDSATEPSLLPMLDMRLFAEIDSTQRIEKSSFVRPNKLEFIFRYPVHDIQITTIPEKDTPWRLDEWSNRRDTLWCWLQNFSDDSLMAVISGHKNTPDTLKFALGEPGSNRERKSTESVKTALQVKRNLSQSGPAHLHMPIILTFSEPVSEFKKEAITLFQDSLAISPSIGFIDKVHRKLEINYPWKEATSYSLLIPDSVFYSISGHANDSLKFKFTTRQASDYGSLKLKVMHPFPEESIIIQLMDEKDKILSEKTVTTDSQVLVFSNLLAGKYRVKAISDSRANGQWDSGIYLRGLQPERVFMYPNSIEVRANWEHEEVFNLRK
ncbi:MAG: Ig-like domain-containing protein [Bacteroidales bacterium]|nr:Ig-like domain-containing protein [Bacteroidales bacterium]MDZ4203984.1 Ig-like domain-containing protein [Bacteroidales bacterium]